MAATSSYRPHRGATRLVAAPTLILTLTTGCAGEQNTSVPGPRTASPHADGLRSPSGADRVPPVDYADPRSMASAFFVAWASYDAVNDGPDAFAARCRPLVTQRLGRELANDQLASADWTGKRRRREVSVIRIAALRQPDGAPAPTPRRMFFRVYGDRVTTSVDGRHVSPTGATVVLVHRDGRWLVNRVLFV